MELHTPQYITGLDANETWHYHTTGQLPPDYHQRIATALQGLKEDWLTCSNCDGVRCMHMRLRDWHEGSGIDECDGNCCPDCGDYHRANPTT